MSDTVILVLVFVFVLLLGVVFVFEKLRLRRLRDTIAEADEPELPSEAFRAFLRGRPTRKITLLRVWRTWRGLLLVPALGYMLYILFSSAFFDPVVRLILLSTAGAGVAIYFLARVLRRNKQERASLPPTS